MRTTPILVAVAWLSGLATQTAAQQILRRASPAAICSDHAQRAADGRMASAEAVGTCTASLASEPLSQKDKLAVLMNRGVLRLSMHQLAEARQDFDAAAVLRPDLGDVYVNRAAVLIGERRYREAVSEADRGLALGPLAPERGFFNRAVAREALGDLRGARDDYAMALQLRPGWFRPEAELARFSARRRP